MARKPGRTTGAAKPAPQCAALPWRLDGDGAVEVLLITSRQTRRWVIPKGWRMKGKSQAASAVREAQEEAGVKGKIRKKPIGAYSYEKRLADGAVQTLDVAVFPLEVLTEAAHWPEANERERAWVPLAEAARRVDEPELQALIAAFEP